jgi:hypothetical protein
MKKSQEREWNEVPIIQRILGSFSRPANVILIIVF